MVIFFFVIALPFMLVAWFVGALSRWVIAAFVLGWRLLDDEETETEK